MNDSMPSSADALPSFETTDRLRLKPFCERLERYLLVEHDYVDDGLVIGLNAGFGAGKTTFLRMWESDLCARRKRNEFVPMPIVLNAWESDYCGDPLMAILASLVDVVDAWEGDVSKQKKKDFKEAAKDVGWFAIGLANEFVAKNTGIDVITAGKHAEEMRGKRQDKVPDFIELYKNRTKALNNLKLRLKEVFGGEVPKVFVFVDELDRCRPDYAVSYLETIKHVFDVRGMVFVLAIDQDHLANSARALFGQDLNFAEYFRKFRHRVIDLAQPDEAALKELTADYVLRFLEIEGKRSCGFDISNRKKDIIELAKGLKMKPRQLQEAFRVIGHVSAVADLSKRGQLLWGIAAMSIFLTCVRISRNDIYFKLKSGRMSHKEVGEFLLSIVGKNEAEWWFKLYLAGLDNEAANALEHEIVLRDVGFLNEGEPFDRRQTFWQFYQAWGMGGSTHLPDIFRLIETVDSFESQ